jgi:hypothetical protein
LLIDLHRNLGYGDLTPRFNLETRKSTCPPAWPLLLLKGSLSLRI